MPGVGCLKCNNQIENVTRICEDSYKKCDGCHRILGKYRLFCSGKKKHLLYVCYHCKELLTKHKTEVEYCAPPIDL